MRRADLALDDAQSIAFLEQARAGRLATTGADGWPYALPMLHVWHEGAVYLHGTAARGHLATNLEHDARACFVVDEPGPVYAYGRFECDSSLAYRSVIVFGRIEPVDDSQGKSLFCDLLMRKYGGDVPAGRPRGFYPRLDAIHVYRLNVERMSGKQIVLPVPALQWPEHDRTRSPHAQAP
jgi:nitroimidazol reductase NimA-like FMN-containing flavoprotein (pyridoxamine 5'-phosphate oxidase superfamily)